MKKKHNGITKLLFFCIAVIVNIKSIFVDYNSDVGYAVAMSHRLLKGDGMFYKMWEPHQTSAFLIAGFMNIYEKVFHTRDGIVICLHFIGFLLFCLTAFFLFKTMVTFVNKDVAFLIGMLFVILRPKMMQIPDYANMTILFSAWFFILLIRYYVAQKSIINLIAASVFMCLNVLAYPSCIILYPGLLVCIVLLSQKRVRDIIVSTATCLIFGGAYLSYFLTKLSLNNLFERLITIVKADTHSGKRVYTGFYYFEEVIIGLAVILFCLIISKLTVNVLDSMHREKKSNFRAVLSIYLAISICLERILVPLLIKRESLGNWCLDKIILIAIVVIGMFGYKRLNSEQKKIYKMGIVISCCTFVSTMILTNLPLITIFGYMHLAVAVSFMSLTTEEEETTDCSEVKRNRNWLAVACLVILTFSQAVYNIDKVENYVRIGPLKGLVTTLNECNKNRLTYESWNRLFNQDDELLIAQEYAVDPIFYTFSEASVSNYSTISTIFLGDGLREYWMEFPDKEPTVIVVPAWQGKEEAALPEWLSSKIEEEYRLTNTEDYWNIYRKK